jgi:photosystem II stability/assembly factor-like uncharacterized protein
MAVLINEYKKIQYLIDTLVLPFIKTNHPKWRNLILAYLEYLDANALNKALNFTDNAYSDTMYAELLDDFLKIYFKDVVDVNKFGLDDANKRLFISLSKLIGNLKATKTSFGFFFNSFTNFSIPSDTGDINVNDMTIELREMPEWWLQNNDPTRPYTYIFKIDNTEISNIKELIKEVHPAGFLQLFLFENTFEDFMNGYDCFELDIRWGVHYNGKYKYDGIQIIEGTSYPLLYNGGRTFSDDLNCAAEPRYFTTSGGPVFNFASVIQGPSFDFLSTAGITMAISSDLTSPGWFFGQSLSQSEIHSSTYDIANGAIFAGTASDAQIWKSTDGGATWTLKKDLSNESPAQSSVLSMEYDRTNDLLFAGTGLDGQIWKSADGGETWTLKKDFSNDPDAETQVQSITHDYLNDVLIATSGTNDALIYRSTDKGETWAVAKDLSAESPAQITASASAFDPSRDRLFVASGNDAQVWTSDDQGVTWTKRLDASDSYSSTRWARSLVYDSKNDVMVFGTANIGQIWTSVDGGINWVMKKQLDQEGDPQTQIWSLAYDPQHGVIYAGTENDSQIWISTDGGNTWSMDTDLGSVYARTITFDNYNRRMIAGRTGGQMWYKTYNPSETTPKDMSDDFQDYAATTQPAARWDTLINDGNGQCTGNWYSYNDSGGSGYSHDKVTLRHKKEFAVASNFDLQLDFNITTMTGVINTDGPTIQLGWETMQTGSRSNWVAIRNSNVGRVYSARTNFEAPSLNQSTSDNTGKLRITYQHYHPTEASRALVTVYYWNDALQRWEWNGDIAGYKIRGDRHTTDGARPFVHFELNGSGALNAYVDNFKVNYASEIEQS